jgi:hypothetical protein
MVLQVDDDDDDDAYLNQIKVIAKRVLQNAKSNLYKINTDHPIRHKRYNTNIIKDTETTEQHSNK